MEKCPLPDCGKEYKNRAGLSSHMAMAHSLSLNGEPLSPEIIAERKAKAKAAMQPTTGSPAAAHSPEARAKAVNTRKERHFEKLKEQGIHRCPECWDKLHRAVDFPRAVELGKHRRFKHGVLGRSQTAEKMREYTVLAKEEAALEAGVQTSLQLDGQLEEEVPQPNVSVFQCPLCPRTFTKQHGLSIHLAQAHKSSTQTALPPSTSQELVKHGIAGTQNSINVPQQLNGHKTGRSHYDDAALAETLAVADAVGNIKGFLGHAADEHDVAPRQFARRVLLALSEHYSS